MEEIVGTIILSSVPVFIIAALIWLHLHARRSVFFWAEKNKYVVLSLRSSLLKGPFWWNSSRKRQKVFRIKIIGNNGKEKKGYVKVGDFWKGVLDPKIEVIWDDEK